MGPARRREASRLRQAGRPLPRSLARRFRLADRLVYSKVKERFGGRLRIAVSGGAPLSPEISEFFHAFDLLILEGYGLTECTTACSFNLPGRYRFGTVGPLTPGLRGAVRRRRGAAPPQRDRVRGLPPRRGGDARGARRRRLGCARATSGASTRTGFLAITDRKKDILVTAGGKNVAPAEPRERAEGSKYVSQALVVGDRRPYVAALITLDEPEVAKWREDGGEISRP